MQLRISMNKTRFVGKRRYLKKPVIYILMGVLVFSIWISSYQVDNTVRKIGRIVDRSRIFPVSYQIRLRMNQKMNGMQKNIYERKNNIFHRFFSLFGYSNFFCMKILTCLLGILLSS